MYVVKRRKNFVTHELFIMIFGILRIKNIKGGLISAIDFYNRSIMTVGLNIYIDPDQIGPPSDKRESKRKVFWWSDGLSANYGDSGGVLLQVR